ncbi:hypothetical protein [Schumannella luteola]
MPHALLRKAAVATGIAAVLACATALPAAADPWDGSDIDFGLGEWDVDANSFTIDDVYLVFPDTSTEYTDIWDGMGYQSITSAGASLADEEVYCDPDSNVDVTVDSATGDLLITCAADNAAFVTAGLTVVSQYRVYAASDLIRVATWITNDNATDVDIDNVEFYTDFGSSGDLWNYQGQSDAVLPVPASEDSTSRDALNGAGAQWAVHFNEYDAPGGIAWGSGAAAAPATLSELSGDEYVAQVSSFTIPAGETRAVAYFALWNPATLITLDYTNDTDSGQVEAANDLVPAMAEFDSFSGRLTAGLEGVSVVNWGPVTPVEPAKPQLAATGADATPAISAGLALLVLGGIATLVAVRRRSATR